MIFKLYIPPPLEKGDEERLRQIFSSFGEIKSIGIYEQAKSPLDLDCKYKDEVSRFYFAFGQLRRWPIPVNNYAIIYFKKAVSAAQALKAKSMCSQKYRISMKPVMSWFQPYKKKLVKPKINITDHANYQINTFYDDCIFMVMEHLPLKEQYNFAQTSNWIKNIFVEFYRVKKTLHIDKYFPVTLMAFKNILTDIGKYIQNIEFGSVGETDDIFVAINFVILMCPNLYKLRLYSICMMNFERSLHNISGKLRHIRHLSLENCHLQDKIMEHLKNLDLIYLNLSNNVISGIHLNNFANLKTLILTACSKILNNNFIAILKTSTKIIKLDITHCHLLQVSGLNAISKYLPELEDLSTCLRYNANDMRVLSKNNSLKYLSIDATGVNDNVTNIINESFEIKLEKLVLITKDIEINKVKNLTNLRELHIYMIGSKYFNLPLVYHLINLEILKISDSIVHSDELLHLVQKLLFIKLIQIQEIEFKCYHHLYHHLCWPSSRKTVEFCNTLCNILEMQNRSDHLKINIKSDNCHLFENNSRFKKINGRNNNMLAILTLNNNDKNDSNKICSDYFNFYGFNVNALN